VLGQRILGLLAGIPLMGQGCPQPLKLCLGVSRGLGLWAGWWLRARRTAWARRGACWLGAWACCWLWPCWGRWWWLRWWSH